MVITLQPPTPMVEVLGDHRLEAVPADAGVLLELLLVKAGFDKPLRWKLRPDKMKHCTADAPPIRVLSYKPFGVQMLLKPGDRSFYHQVTLLIPDGSMYKAEYIYNQLRNLQKSVSRQWRTELRKKAEPPKSPLPFDIPKFPPVFPDPPKSYGQVRPLVSETPVPPVPPPPPPPPAEVEVLPHFDNLQKISASQKKLRFTLTQIHQIASKSNLTFKEFRELVQRECGWSEHKPVAVGRALAQLAKEGYVMEMHNSRDKLIGYCLDYKGRDLIGANELIYTKPPAPEVKKKKNYGGLLISIKDKVAELAAASAYLDNLHESREHLVEQRKQLVDQIAELDKQIADHDRQYEELSETIVTDDASGEILSRLLGVTVSVPEKK